MIDDARLLREYVQTRSEMAFAELVERHLGLVYHSALRQLDRDSYLAEDVAQTVFVLLAAKAPTLLGHPSLVGWLYAATHFKVSKAKETERRRRFREATAYSMHETLTDSRPSANWEQIRPILDEAILELNDRDRETILLRFFEGRPFSDIASHLLLSEKTTHKRMERALDNLREGLSRRGITSTAAALAASLATQATMAAPVGLAAKVTGTVMLSAGTAASSLSSAIAATINTNAGVAWFTGVAALVGFLAIGTGICELRSYFRAQSSLRASVTQLEIEQDQLRGLERNRKNASQTLDDLQHQMVQLHSVNEARVASNTRAQAKSKADWHLFQLAYPESQDMLIDVARAQIEGRYGFFFRRAALTSTQIIEFENRTAELWLQNIVLTPDHSFYPTVLQLPDDQLHAILGEAAFREFQEFTRMMPANLLATAVCVSTAYAGAPLSSEQESRIAQIVADNCPTYKSGLEMAQAPVDWANAETEAQRQLSPTQWQAAAAVMLGFQFAQETVLAAQNQVLVAVVSAKE